MNRGAVIAIGVLVAALSGCPAEDSKSDTPAPGLLQFSSVGFGAGESSGAASIIVTRQGGSAGAVSVQVFIAGGTASPGADYPWYIDYVESLQWPDGDSSPKLVSLPIFDDTILEGDETIDLTLAFVEGGAALGPTSDTTLTVVDSESPLSGSLQFASAQSSVIESAGVATINVTRTGGSVGTVSVQVYVMGGSAMLGGDVPQWIDYVADLTWADGDAADKSFDVPIFDDAMAENDETVQFILLYPTGGAAMGSPSDTVLTIIDDD